MALSKFVTLISSGRSSAQSTLFHIVRYDDDDHDDDNDDDANDDDYYDKFVILIVFRPAGSFAY